MNNIVVLYKSLELNTSSSYYSNRSQSPRPMDDKSRTSAIFPREVHNYHTTNDLKNYA